MFQAYGTLTIVSHPVFYFTCCFPVVAISSKTYAAEDFTVYWGYSQCGKFDVFLEYKI